MGVGGKQIKENKGTWLQSKMAPKGYLQHVKSRRHPQHRAYEEWGHPSLASLKSFTWEGILSKPRLSSQVCHQPVMWYASKHLSSLNLFPHLWKWTQFYLLSPSGSQNWRLNEVKFSDSLSQYTKSSQIGPTLWLLLYYLTIHLSVIKWD